MKNRISFFLVVVIGLITTKITFSQSSSIYRNGTFLYNKADKSDYSIDYKEISSLNFKDGQLILVKKVNLYDTRTNPDQGKFYRTTFGIIIDNGNDVKINEIETVLYTNKAYDPAMTPCMLFDPENNVVTIFANGKNPESSNYGMEGFAYRIDLSNKTWSKETVFDRANWGFFSFFGGSDNGNPVLWHFSFAGYYSMKSTRNYSGSWSNSNEGSYRPETASNEYPYRKNILVTSSSGIDRMSRNSTSNSSSSYLLTENQVAIGAALILGTVLWQGAKWLVNNSGSSSSASYGSSSSSSSYGSSSSSNSSYNSSSNSDNEWEEKQIERCVKKFNSDLIVNDSYCSDNSIAYGLSSGNFGSWYFTYVEKSTLSKEKGWYIHKKVNFDDGPYPSKYEVIQKYCEKAYK